MRQQSMDMALELGVIGLMNVQFAVKNNDVYVLEVNPPPLVLCRLSPNVLVFRWQKLQRVVWQAKV